MQQNYLLEEYGREKDKKLVYVIEINKKLKLEMVLSKVKVKISYIKIKKLESELYDMRGEWTHAKNNFIKVREEL